MDSSIRSCFKFFGYKNLCAIKLLDFFSFCPILEIHPGIIEAFRRILVIPTPELQVLLQDNQCASCHPSRDTKVEGMHRTKLYLHRVKEVQLGKYTSREEGCQGFKCY